MILIVYNSLMAQKRVKYQDKVYNCDIDVGIQNSLLHNDDGKKGMDKKEDLSNIPVQVKKSKTSVSWKKRLRFTRQRELIESPEDSDDSDVSPDIVNAIHCVSTALLPDRSYNKKVVHTQLCLI